MFDIGRELVGELENTIQEIYDFSKMPLESNLTLSECKDYWNQQFNDYFDQRLDDVLVIDRSEMNGIQNLLEGREVVDTGNDRELSKEEKIDKQEKELASVESGEKEFDKKNTRETGNYGEMKTDQKLRGLGYERISSDMVTDIDESGHQGLDGVYYNPNGKPKYIIADSKYGSAQLNPETKDGKQMSENWIDKRLDQAVGKEKADEIRMEKMKDPDSVGSYVSHVDSEGNVKFDKLDNNANVVEKDVKIND